MSPNWVGLVRNRAVRAVRWVTEEWGTRRVRDPHFERGLLLRHQTKHGSYYLPEDAHLSPGGRQAAAAVRAGDVSNSPLLEAVGACVEREMVVFDIGARFGQRSRVLAEMVGPHGQVCAFEADPSTFAVLRRNLALSKLPVRAFLLRAGGGNGDGVALSDLESAPVPNVICADVATAGFLPGIVGILKRTQAVLVTTCRDQEALRRLATDTGLVFTDLGRGVVRLAPSARPSLRNEVRGLVPLPRLAQRKLAEFLRSRSDVEEATHFLHQNGFVSHSLPCKDWDLARIIPEIGDGNLIDMGSSDSYILKNIALRGGTGELFGIDLRAPDVPVRGVRYLVGDLMDVPCKDGYFQFVTCLSVIEHQVGFRALAREASRLLSEGGLFFVTFDYWEPRVRPDRKLYGLEWQPLDRAALEEFLSECADAGLELAEEMDWTLGEPVIRDGYYSPQPGVRYTFGLVTLRKRKSEG